MVAVHVLVFVSPSRKLIVGEGRVELEVNEAILGQISYFRERMAERATEQAEPLCDLSWSDPETLSMVFSGVSEGSFSNGEIDSYSNAVRLVKVYAGAVRLSSIGDRYHQTLGNLKFEQMINELRDQLVLFFGVYSSNGGDPLQYLVPALAAFKISAYGIDELLYQLLVHELSFQIISMTTDRSSLSANSNLIYIFGEDRNQSGRDLAAVVLTIEVLKQKKIMRIQDCMTEYEIPLEGSPMKSARVMIRRKPGALHTKQDVCKCKPCLLRRAHDHFPKAKAEKTGARKCI